MHIRILAVDDDPNDSFLLRQAFESLGKAYEFFPLTDGWVAIDYFSGHPPYHDRLKHPLPQLAVLDVKMPHLTGFEVLTWIRGRPELADMPVVMLSSSDHPEDMAMATKLGANDYQVKPPSFTSLVKLVEELDARWLGESTPLASKRAEGPADSPRSRKKAA